MNILMTSGVSFIGSHLVDALADKDRTVTVSDDLSSGRDCNLFHCIQKHPDHVTFVKSDCRRPEDAKKAFEEVETVFHLVAL